MSLLKVLITLLGFNFVCLVVVGDLMECNFMRLLVLQTKLRLVILKWGSLINVRLLGGEGFEVIRMSD